MAASDNINKQKLSIIAEDSISKNIDTGDLLSKNSVIQEESIEQSQRHSP